MPQIIKTITIKSGEQFVLPPGAVVTTVIGMLGSSGCTLPSPSQLSCYAFQFSAANKSGSRTPAYDDVRLLGIILNGVKYDFTNPVLLDPGNGTNTDLHSVQFINAISNLPIGNLFFEVHSYSETDPDRFLVGVIWFKIPESLAENSYVIARGSITGNNFDEGTPIYLPIVKPENIVNRIKDSITC